MTAEPFPPSGGTGSTPAESTTAPPASARPATRPITLFSVIRLFVVAAWIIALPLTVISSDYEVWGGLIIAPLLAFATWPILNRVFRHDNDPWLLDLVRTALFLKLLGAFVRYYVTSEYLGPADATLYSKAGGELAREFRDGVFGGVAYDEHIPELSGTPFIRLVTGVFYSFTGESTVAGFVVYSWLGFIGLVLCYRAFRAAVPDGSQHRYALLLFFLPSLLFWPSSIGKDAWMLFTVGIAIYGAARILGHHRNGFLILGLGLLGTAMVRPHITLMLFFGLAVGYLLRRRRADRPAANPAAKVFGIIVLAVVGVLVVNRTGVFFEVEGRGTAAVDQVLSSVETGTAQGGSEFESSRPSSPLEWPLALVTVPFRPFPFEASSGTAFIASLEGLLLLVLFCDPRRLARLPRQLLRIPYAAFAATYTLLFVFAFSAVGNFGILVRQRAQLFPLLLVLICLPVAEKVATKPPLTRASDPNGSGRGR